MYNTILSWRFWLPRIANFILFCFLFISFFCIFYNFIQISIKIYINTRNITIPYNYRRRPLLYYCATIILTTNMGHNLLSSWSIYNTTQLQNAHLLNIPATIRSITVTNCLSHSCAVTPESNGFSNLLRVRCKKKERKIHASPGKVLRLASKRSPLGKVRSI